GSSRNAGLSSCGDIWLNISAIARCSKAASIPPSSHLRRSELYLLGSHAGRAIKLIDHCAPQAGVDTARPRANFPRMKKRLVQALVILVIVLNLALGARLYRAVAAQEKDESGYSSIAVFARAMQIIRQDYVDEKKISYE